MRQIVGFVLLCAGVVAGYLAYAWGSGADAFDITTPGTDTANIALLFTRLNLFVLGGAAAVISTVLICFGLLIAIDDRKAP